MTEQMDKFYEIARDKPKPRVMTGDARRISEILGGEQVDLVVTSPPYGTGSKYSEVYRLSFEWLSLQRPPRSESLERSSSFAAELRTCIQEIYKSLKPNKYLCFVYGDPSAENGLTRQAVADAKEAGFVFRGLISCPIAKEKYNHGTTYRRFIPKDFVLIFQK